MWSTLVGCSAPPQRAEPIAAPEENKPLLYIVAQDSPPGFRPAAEAVAKEALAGARLTFDASNADQAVVRIDLDLQYRDLTESEFESIWRTTTTLLLTMYPSTCRHRAYDLKATVSGSGGVSRAYAKSDSTVAWVWLFQAPHCGESPTAEEIRSETQTMLAAIFRDIQRDGGLEAAIHSTIRVPSPRVRLVANRAQTIVEQVMHMERPREQWSVTDDGQGPPEYLIDLRFDIQEGVFSAGRAFLGIFTAGASTLFGGLCTASQISLVATVSGPASMPTSGYRFSESVATHMNHDQCESVNETNHPEVFAALLRQLLDQIRRDELIKAHLADERALAVPPLVRIEAIRGESVVREAVLKSNAFRRYVFGSESSMSEPEYVMRIDISTEGGAERMNIMEAIGTGLVLGTTGIDLSCEPTTFTLQAHLSDRAGADVRDYKISRKFSYSGRRHQPGCMDNETTNPDAVRELLQELFLRMEQDGALALLAANGTAQDSTAK